MEHNNFTGDYFPHEEEFDLKRYLSLLSRKKWIFFSILSVVMALTFIYTFRQTPIYRATANILIESPSASLSLSATQKVRVFPRIGQDNYYNTQYKILASYMLAKRVRKALDLPFSAKKLQNMVIINPIRKTRLVKINIDDEDPLRATKIANTLVTLYIEQNIESMLFMSKEVLKAFPENAKGIEEHTVYGQIEEFSKEESIESLPPIAQDPLLRSLKTKKVELETEIANLGKRYKSKHPKMASQLAELKFVNEKISIETDRILRSVKADLAGRLQANNIRVIDYAEVPKRPIRPQKLKNMLYALFLSMFLGIGVIIFTEYLDDTIKTQNDIEKKLDLPYLGHFPAVKTGNAPLFSSGDFTNVEKNADASNFIRVIKTNLLFSAPRDKAKTVLFTSTIPQEGKSFLASYIAFAFAQSGTKTLLLDADIRRSTLHKLFGFKREPGLTNLLVENIKPHDVIKKTKYANLYILPSGATTPSPLELLSSDGMGILLKEFLKTFEKIIIDAAPGLLLPDALVLSKISDITVFVAKAGIVNKSAFVNLKNKFYAIDSKVAGVILNFFRTEKHSDYRYSYYYRYYKNYYSDNDKASSRN